MQASLQLWWEVCVLLCWQLLFKSISRCSCLVVCPFLYLECLGSFLVVARCNFIIVAGDSKLVVVFKGLSSCSAWALWLYCESLVVPRLVGFLVPQPGIEPESPALQGFLATGPPGKSYLLTVDATIDTLLAGLTQPSQELCGSEGHRLHTACCWPVASAQLLAFCAPSRALGSPRHSCVFSQSFSHQLLSKLNHDYINQSSIKARRKGCCCKN